MDGRNHFLACLEPAERALIEPGLVRRRLIRDAVLAETGRTLSQVVLPLNAIISVMTVMRDGRAVESRTIGREGGFGLLHALGSPLSFDHVTVQVGGDALILPLDQLRAAADRSSSLTHKIVAHAQAEMTQAGVAVACNALHGARERLCRWLLLTQDRLECDVLPLTQEHLSIMLGVQRTTVTALASELQQEGAISYRRGKVQVLDRDGLIERACECYCGMEGAADAILRGVEASNF